MVFPLFYPLQDMGNGTNGNAVATHDTLLNFVQPQIDFVWHLGDIACKKGLGADLVFFSLSHVYAITATIEQMRTTPSCTLRSSSNTKMYTMIGKVKLIQMETCLDSLEVSHSFFSRAKYLKAG